jgi:hypothetical protein
MCEKCLASLFGGSKRASPPNSEWIEPGHSGSYAPPTRKGIKMALQFKVGKVDHAATVSLRKMKKFPAKNIGSLESAVMSAAYYAKKYQHDMFIYVGNSFMHQVHRVSDRPSEYLSPINNTGDKMLSVSPDLEVRWHDLVS